MWESPVGHKNGFQTCYSTLQHDGLQENAAWIPVPLLIKNKI